jgi:hypothetical protein
VEAIALSRTWWRSTATLLLLPLRDSGICETLATEATPGTARSTSASRFMVASCCSGLSLLRLRAMM